MKYRVYYNRVDSIVFTLEESDLRDAAITKAKASSLWPKNGWAWNVSTEFGDRDDGDGPTRVYCEVTLAYSQPMEPPPSADAVDPVLSSSVDPSTRDEKNPNLAAGKESE